MDRGPIDCRNYILIQLLAIPWGNYFGWFCVIFYSSLVLYFMDQRFTKDSFEVLSSSNNWWGDCCEKFCLFLSLLLGLALHLIHHVAPLYFYYPIWVE